MSLSKDSTVAVITGTTSNLGLNIAYRLLEQLLPNENVVIVVTSRTLPKVQEAIQLIKKFNTTLGRPGKVEFDYLLVDFTDMVSVLSAYYSLSKNYSQINYFFVNAAQSTYSGINWLQAFGDIAKGPLAAVTAPKYKVQRTGIKTGDGMGLVFQANVFGPYYLLHKIKPLLQKGEARVVWISSVMSAAEYLSFNDLQLLKTHEPYEGSKRIVDLLHFAKYKDLKKLGIRQYVTLPGIFTSYSFFQFLNVFTYYGMLILFYFARLIGLDIHNISGYTAANAPVKCAIQDEPQDVKVASCSNILGKEYIRYENIDQTGAEDVGKYFDDLVEEWDEKLKDQITILRL